MAKEINLIPEKEGLPKAERQARSLFQTLAIGFIALVFVVAVGVLVYGQILIAQEKDIENKNANLVSVISNLRDREILLRVTKTKSEGINQIVGNRPDFSLVLDNVSKLLPAGVMVTELLVKPDGTTTVTVHSDGSSSLNTFLSTLIDPARGGVTFGHVSVDKLANDKTGGYQMTVTMQSLGQKWLQSK